MVTEKFTGDITGGGFNGAGNASAFSPNSLIGVPAWGPGQNLPNGTRTGTGYDNDVNGAVSVHHMETANFLFVDGHVKSMKPYLTNHDPTNRPQDNMWNGVR